jgi:hypothetical protein
MCGSSVLESCRLLILAAGLALAVMAPPDLTLAGAPSPDQPALAKQQLFEGIRWTFGRIKYRAWAGRRPNLC